MLRRGQGVEVLAGGEWAPTVVIRGGYETFEAAGVADELRLEDEDMLWRRGAAPAHDDEVAPPRPVPLVPRYVRLPVGVHEYVDAFFGGLP